MPDNKSGKSPGYVREIFPGLAACFVVSEILRSTVAYARDTPESWVREYAVRNPDDRRRSPRGNIYFFVETADVAVLDTTQAIKPQHTKS
jgi:hypothetical protein